MAVMSNLYINNIFLFLQELNSTKLLLFIVGLLLFWILFFSLLVQLLPKKYKPYKKEIFIFMVIINMGLLFMGMVLTLAMFLFGLAWASHRMSRPTYQILQLEAYVVDEFPMVTSQFSEGVLAIDSHHNRNISTNEKIKALRILYESNVQDNIGKIKLFLSDSSDETRLYAFSLISSFEKRLNDEVKNFHKKIETASNQHDLEMYHLRLAQSYWQFIFHGVANVQLTRFYTDKIEQTLQHIDHSSKASLLLGKIHLFNKEYEKAEAMFLQAVEQGTPKKHIDTYLAEIRYSQKAYNEIAQFMEKAFVIDLRLKPLYHIWKKA